LFRPKVGIRIYPRYEISIPLQQSCREDTGAQIRAETLRHGNIRQVRLFENLPADASLLSKEALQLHHQTSLFIQDFEDLVSRGRHAV
jgi:hypothetical protein